MIPELFALILLIPARGALLLAERSLAWSRRTVLRQMVSRSRGARLALKLLGRPERTGPLLRGGLLLADILIGATGGAVLGPWMASWLRAWGFQPVAAGILGVAAAALAVALATLIFGDRIPRRAARWTPEAFARVAAYPLVALLRLRDLLPWPTMREPVRTPDRLNAPNPQAPLPAHAAANAVPQAASAQDRALIDRVLRLGDRTAENLMTPRPRIAWLDLHGTREENLQVLRENPYSRYPVYRGSDNDVVGILETRSLARLLSAGAHPDLFGELLPPTFVSESTRAITLLETFRNEGTHMALVVDEYGDLQGLVTLDDLLDAVIGQMHQQEDDADDDAPVVARDDGSWLVDGGLASEDLRELLGLESLPGEDEHDFNTAAGMAVSWFGRIPAPGESFDHAGWRIEVVDLDGVRVDKLLIQRLIPSAEGISGP